MPTTCIANEAQQWLSVRRASLRHTQWTLENIKEKYEKTVLISIMFLIVNFSCSQSNNNKQKQLESFQSEMKKINDSSALYFDIGIKMLENGFNPTKVTDSIRSKLKYFQSELNKKARRFHKTAEKLKLTQDEYDKVFNELNESFKKNLEKYQFLKENGVEINL